MSRDRSADVSSVVSSANLERSVKVDFWTSLASGPAAMLYLYADCGSASSLVRVNISGTVLSRGDPNANEKYACCSRECIRV